MFKNYFKVSIRSLMKNPLNSFINIFGLALAIGICIFAYAFAQWTYSTDQFHEYKNDVYLVTFSANRDGTPQQFGITPRPLGDVIKQEFTQVDKVCRIEDRAVVMKYEHNVFHEHVRFTDPEFLQMFTFPMKWGVAGTLADQSSIILSENMSIKYFGTENPLGRELILKFDQNNHKSFKVTGVAQAFPPSRSIEFDFLINFEILNTVDSSDKINDWSAFVNATFIQVNDVDQLASVKTGLEKYRLLQNEKVGDDWAISAFAFQPLATLHRHASEIRDDISVSSDSKYLSIIFIGIISSFMLILACFNYINIAIVSATKRLKEIGVRKTVGASRRVVIVQFLMENILITFFAMITGVLLGTFAFIPWMESITHFNFGFSLIDLKLWLYLPAILLITGIASGLYPAFYISTFKVAGILKGSVTFGKKNPLTKLFLGIQLVLACILITAGVMFTQNTNYMKERSWGYNQQQAIYAAIPDGKAFEKLNAVMIAEPAVMEISGSQHHLGKTHTKTILYLRDRQYEVDELAVAPNYFRTMELQLAEGRVFYEDVESESNTVVVNQALVEAMSLENPVGQLVRIDSVQYEIIGVLKEFHTYSFFKKVNPAIFRIADKESYRYLAVKALPGSEAKALKALKAGWAKLYPDVPFDGGFQEDVWGTYVEQINRNAKVWNAFAMIAIILASLGLYGLVSFNVTGRTKEFSVRKILGAGIKSIAQKHYQPVYFTFHGVSSFGCTGDLRFN